MFFYTPKKRVQILEKLACDFLPQALDEGHKTKFFSQKFFIQNSKNSSHLESIHTMFCISKYIRNIFETILKIKNWWPKNWFFQVKKFLWFGSVHAIYCVSWVNYWPKIWKKMTKISPELKFKFEKNFTKISPKLKGIFNGPGRLS